MTDSALRIPLFRVSRSYGAQAVDTAWLSLKNRIWVLIALAVGLFVRVNALGVQSLWNDEGTSVAVAKLSLGAIANAAANDIHPPLYYWLLHFWIPLTGDGEFAIRFLSVFAGVLVIAVTFRIAREFFDQDVAVIAAVLSAFNVFQTYYAQETRMYIWVTLFAALSVWMMVRLFKPSRAPLSPTRRLYIAFIAGYVLFTLAALYTNYYAFTLVAFENIAFLFWLIWAWRNQQPLVRAFALWVGMQIVIALAYLPWLVMARQSLTSWPGISEPMSLTGMTWKIAGAFSTGADTPLDYQFALVAAYILFFIGGLLPSRDLFKHSVWGIVTCALWALVPLLAMYVVSLSRPAYNPKFLLLATPGFLICVARGVSVLYPGLFLRERAPYATIRDPIKTRLARQYIGIIKLFVGGLFAAGTVLALQNMYDDPRLQRDNYRGIVNYINAVATSDDAVIVNAPGQLDVVRYYYHSPARLIGLPIGRPIDETATANALQELITTRTNLYGIFWATDQSDPHQEIESALAQYTFQAGDDWHGNVRLAQYAIESQPRVFDGRIPFGDEIFLRRFGLGDKPLAGGDILPLDFVWVALKPPAANYKVFVHLLDSSGHIISQHDGEPHNGLQPTSQWEPGVEVDDRVGVVIPPGTPPGEYSLAMGIYRADTGARLTLKDGTDTLTLGSLTVGKRLFSRAAMLYKPIQHAEFSTLDALGYQLAQTDYARGEFIPLVLYFQARATLPSDLNIQVQLRDQGDNVITSVRAFPAYPTSRWDVNEIVRDVESLAIPQNALVGEYKMVLTDGAQTFPLTRVRVQ